MIKLERLDDGGTYSSPENKENETRSERYFISRRKMILFVAIAVVLCILSAVLGTVLSSSSPENDKVESPATQPTVSGRWSKRAEKVTQKPKDKNPSYWKRFRLPRDIIPLHYAVTIRVNMSAVTFYGLVKIQVYIKKDTQFLILHSDPKRMKYKSMTIKDIAGRKMIDKKQAWHYKDFLVVEVETKLIKGRKYTAWIHFYSIFSNFPPLGLYWIDGSTYDRTKGLWIQQKKMAVTFFSPVAARRNFPCFDEPDMKARFLLTLIYNRGYTAISNMPLETRRMTKQLVFDRFKTSLIMSTYLLNYVITDYTFSKTVTANGTSIRVWSPEHTSREREYALHAANVTLPFYESLFGISYPMSKLDMIAVPGFPVAAMENWGLVNYITRGMLHDEKDNSRSNLLKKQNTALLISHEIVHQWVGNLVTLQWWNDNFIQEGFATYLQYYGVDFIDPTLEIMDQFYNIATRAAMKQDSKKSSHSIARRVTNSNEIMANVNHLVYFKGGAIFRMLHKFLGNKAFFDGLTYYLKKYAYRNADQNELWDSFSSVSKLNIGSIMRTWTLKSGFPVITAKQITANEVIIDQHRFIAGEAKDGKLDPSLWRVPISYVTSTQPRKTNWYILSNRSARLKIENNTWFKLNSNADGYYIVNYDVMNWKGIINQLNNDHSVFSVLDRASLIKDAFTFAEEGLLPYDVAIEATKYLDKEKQWIPWQYAKQYISDIIQRLSKLSKTRTLLLKYFAKISSPLLEKYGIDAKIRNTLKDRTLQETAVTAALNAQNETMSEVAKRMFRNWMINQTAIPNNLAKVIYFYGVLNGGKEEWDHVYRTYSHLPGVDERTALLEALGASTDSWTLNRFMQLGLHSRYLDFSAVLKAVADGSNAGRSIAWAFVKENWNRIGRAYSPLIVLTNVIDKFANVYYYNDVYKFLRLKLGRRMKAKRVIDLISKIKRNVEWTKKSKPRIQNWLEKYFENGNKH